VFTLNNDRPLFAFAGIWTVFKGDCNTKSKPVHGPYPVYDFLLGLSSRDGMRLLIGPKAKTR
jgi:hypothetical protein